MTNNKLIRALFPASFDPITLGHMDLIKRASKMCQELIILITNNLGKKYLLDIEQRKELVSLALKQLDITDCKIIVHTSHDLLVHDYLKYQADFIVRGIRNSADLEYEQNYEQINRQLFTTYVESNQQAAQSCKLEFETVYLNADPDLKYISSTGVRQLLTMPESFATYADKWLSSEVKTALSTMLNLK
ncbi:pantetheine-phosphate adenylyltransferase [Psittacicella hinzii]|uniref:Phosphopantetheine adenylyltransferase n=1 Tax=Psittacicella hinzii TaxID=2028575 RepID=A0A3A1Y8V2_9GAMM|nr:pantetheine-phosphate adenylyltransferase [Psittacicella hinzii]RIY34743.1 pantetheine-phosphate adenylyltransferase [Psittacicella hinzii]